MLMHLQLLTGADPRGLAWRGAAQRKRVGPHLFNPALKTETKSAATYAEGRDRVCHPTPASQRDAIAFASTAKAAHCKP